MPDAFEGTTLAAATGILKERKHVSRTNISNIELEKIGNRRRAAAS
jgi:hypothetical protein